MYYDDSAKRSMQAKIAAAMAAYEVRFNGTPDLVWVNAAVTPDLQVEHLVIERRITVRPNTIWVGRQPAATPEEA
jgi:multisubunit Na+/H+ antiporter MnhE subunit